MSTLWAPNFSHGGFSGSRIALIGSGCYEWITAYLAVVNGVGTVVPIDKDLEPEVMQNLINRAECDAVFFSSDIGDKADSLRGIRLRVEMDYYGDRTEFGESLSQPPEGRRRSLETAGGKRRKTRTVGRPQLYRLQHRCRCHVGPALYVRNHRYSERSQC